MFSQRIRPINQKCIVASMKNFKTGKTHLGYQNTKQQLHFVMTEKNYKEDFCGAGNVLIPDLDFDSMGMFTLGKQLS